MKSRAKNPPRHHAAVRFFERRDDGGRQAGAGQPAFHSVRSRRDQEHLLELRATADAVMSGARTVDLSPVKLGRAAANTAGSGCGAA